MLLYDHRDRIRDWKPRTATSTFTQLLSSGREAWEVGGGREGGGERQGETERENVEQQSNHVRVLYKLLIHVFAHEGFLKAARSAGFLRHCVWNIYAYNIYIYNYTDLPQALKWRTLDSSEYQERRPSLQCPQYSRCWLHFV